MTISKKTRSRFAELTSFVFALILCSCSKNDVVDPTLQKRVQIIDYTTLLPMANVAVQTYGFVPDGLFSTTGTIAPGRKIVTDNNGFIEFEKGQIWLDFAGSTYWNPFLNKTRVELIGGTPFDYEDGKQYFFPRAKLVLDLIDKQKKGSLAQIEITLSIVSEINGVSANRKYWSQIHANAPDELKTTIEAVGDVINYIGLHVSDGPAIIDTVFEINPKKQASTSVQLQY